MVRIVIYGEKPTDIEGLEKMLCEILTENRRWPMIHTYISDLDAYLHFVKGIPTSLCWRPCRADREWKS